MCWGRWSENYGAKVAPSRAQTQDRIGPAGIGSEVGVVEWVWQLMWLSGWSSWVWLYKSSE